MSRARMHARSGIVLHHRVPVVREFETIAIVGSPARSLWPGPRERLAEQFLRPLKTFVRQEQGLRHVHRICNQPRCSRSVTFQSKLFQAHRSSCSVSQPRHKHPTAESRRMPASSRSRSSPKYDAFLHPQDSGSCLAALDLHPALADERHGCIKLGANSGQVEMPLKKKKTRHDGRRARPSKRRLSVDARCWLRGRIAAN
jgi:hypothetical protein